MYVCFDPCLDRYQALLLNMLFFVELFTLKKLRGPSPRVTYTDRAAVACRRS
jgi:hypothetical protein